MWQLNKLPDIVTTLCEDLQERKTIFQSTQQREARVSSIQGHTWSCDRASWNPGFLAPIWCVPATAVEWAHFHAICTSPQGPQGWGL
jgi:hypothetical protein